MKNFRQKVSLLFLILVFVVTTALPCLAAEAKANDDARIVRVGYYQYKNFQEYDEETEQYSGYSYEFLMALSQYTNWKLEFVPCTFNEALVMLENGELDLVNDVSKTEERESKYEFSSLSTGETVSYLVMKSGDTRVAYDDLEGIAGIKIALSRQSIHSEQLLATLKVRGVIPDAVWFDNHEEVMKAVEEGKADAYITTSTTVTNEHTILSFSPEPYYLATTKGNTRLMAEVNHAIESLRANSPRFEANLSEKYYSKINENYTVFTRKEQEYIAKNQLTRVLYVPNWYPISYQDDKGEFAGPIRGIYDLLEERTGLKFEFVPVDLDNESNDIVRTYNCYIMADQPTDYSGASLYDVKLTQAFVNPPLVEISTHTLSSGDTIALVSGDYLSEVVERVFGDRFQYVYLDSLEDCLTQVKDKTADGTILISYEAEYYRNMREYRNLVYTIVNEGSYGLSAAVSNEADPCLYSIIVKGLNSLTAGEISNIFNNTLQSLQKDDFLTVIYKNPAPAFAVMALIVALMVGTLMGWIFVRKLNEKNEELRRANESTNQFFARMSHDMRTPMNGILGVSRLAQEETDPQVWRESLVKVEESGEYLLSLINDTLDFQRIESGNLKLQNEIVHSSDILRSMTDMIAPSAEAKNIDLRIDTKNMMLDSYIWVDPVRLKQIFINLISNAVKFTPEGGTIVVEGECKEERGMIFCDRFYIRDSGIGMSQDYIQNRLFKPFSQEHSEVTAQYAGSGLGLSIVKSLVDLMGGTIQVESELGSGTTFIIDIDFERVSQEDVEKYLAKEDKKQNAVVQSISGCRVLLVEDHPLNAEIAKKLLEKAGCTIDWAKNGQEGVDVFSKSNIHFYDVILMDIRMPVMDGLEAARAIRALNRKDAKTVPIIAMTANAYEEDVKKSLDAGMNAHLAKPIDPKELYKTIAKELL